MAYTKSTINHLIELIQMIEGRKEHPNAATTYKDISALYEIETIVKEQLALEKPYDYDTLTNSIILVRYLGEAYESMWRIAYAVKWQKVLFELYLELYRRFGETDKQCANDYYIALRARNYYYSDPCLDLTEIAKEFLPQKKCSEIEKQVLENFHPIKHDPVELTDGYLSVIDKVEQIMETESQKKLHPFHWNQLFQQLLRQHGVEWKTIMELNPNIHFD